MSKGKKIQPVRKSPRKRSAPSYQESPDQSDIEVDELEVSSYSQGWDDGSTEEEDEQRPVSASLVTETTVKFNPEQEETWILDTVGPPELKTCKVCGESCSSRASKMKHQKEAHPPVEIGGQKWFRCETGECFGKNALFSQRNAYNRHHREVHAQESKRFQCTFCSATFRSRFLCRRHCLLHKENLKCDLCGVLFPVGSTYNKHRMRCSGILVPHRNPDEENSAPEHRATPEDQDMPSGETEVDALEGDDLVEDLDLGFLADDGAGPSGVTAEECSQMKEYSKRTSRTTEVTEEVSRFTRLAETEVQQQDLQDRGGRDERDEQLHDREADLQDEEDVDDQAEVRGQRQDGGTRFQGPGTQAESHA